METINDLNAYIAGKHGIVKGLFIQDKSCIMKTIKKNLSKRNELIDNNQEITAMEWSDNNETDILVGIRTKDFRSVQVYDSKQHQFDNSYKCNLGEGSIVGFSKLNEKIICAVESGHVQILNDNGSEELIVEAGSDLLKMYSSVENRHCIATGGDENPLKVFDLNKRENIFTAKNVPHDQLELRVPVHISDLKFLNSDKEVVTISKYGHVRLYDLKAQRRPVVKFEVKDEALSALAVCSNDREIIFGTGRGKMNLVDLRKNTKIMSTYKGAVGAITSIAVSKVEPLIVCTSLDRNVYVHDLKKKNLLKKVYLTSKLLHLVMRSEFSLKTVKEDEEENDEDFFC